MVQSKERARQVLEHMRSPKYADVVWACDTEVADIEVSELSPVGNGVLTCASIFGGPDVDLGEGPGQALWIDNLGEASGVLLEFKSWFEDPKVKKVWHNYGFDRHIMNNEGIEVSGFWGDTMHMARLQDTSRDRSFGAGKGYSLESISDDFVADARLKKVSMKELFGVGKLKKDGTPGAVKEIPPIRELQTSPVSRDKWIEYSAKDAVATWYVHDVLVKALLELPWEVNFDPTRGETGKIVGNMYDFYIEYLRDFGELLTEMERNGIKLNTESLKSAEKRAREERDAMEALFLKWAEENGLGENAKYVNTASSAQIGHFLFGHYDNGPEGGARRERAFKLDKDEEEMARETAAAEKENPYVHLTAPELKVLLKERKLKVSGKKTDLIQRLMDFDAVPVNFDTMDDTALRNMSATRGLPEGDRDAMIATLTADLQFASGMVQERDRAEAAAAAALVTKPKKSREIIISSHLLRPTDWTPGGTPQVSAAVLKKLAGSTPFVDKEEEFKPGAAYEHFAVKGAEAGRMACRALGALAAVGQIDATITNFLVPLQNLVDKNSRVHCSLNLNTETGRLSSKRPNLQNQPALEKDQYKIRDAFVAEEGNTLVVADYGQLELRLMAHMTNCQSMLAAFRDGGCFHSRTAVGMYPYIRDAVDNGKVLLEWDYSKGQPTVPLVKDTYASERRKAKTLNFSIAYGKTVHGLAQDWGISKEEAETTLKAWYSDRPEVKKWQDLTRKRAVKDGNVVTLMGRYRMLPDAKLPLGAKQGHALRAAINTPIQGSAADIVMMAMIKLWRSEKLKALGWKLLLQIHDEVILEGPRGSKDEALAEVRAVMENPFDQRLTGLFVHLDVDAKSADTWYKAK